MRSRLLSTGRRRGRAPVAVAAAAVAVGLLGSGCAVPNFSTESQPTRELPPPPELRTREPSAPELRRSLTGSWRGTYTCPQGLMRLNLTLVQRSDRTVTGIFRFSPAPGNSDASSGSFTLRGTATSSSLLLRGDRWISRPGSYEMVSLSASLSGTDTNVIRGSIRSPGCGSFTVRR
ncbi:hypothetical protein ACN3XK_53260 [Actinomadura welshii]